MILALMKELSQEAANARVAEGSPKLSPKFKCFLCEKRSPKLEATATICAHLFHEGCLNGWLKYNNRCPQCANELKNRELLAGKTPYPLNLGISSLEAERLKSIPLTKEEIEEKSLQEFLSGPAEEEFTLPDGIKEDPEFPSENEETQSAPPPRSLEIEVEFPVDEDDRTQSAPPLTVGHVLEVIEEEPREDLNEQAEVTEDPINRTEIILEVQHRYGRSMQCISAGCVGIGVTLIVLSQKISALYASTIVGVSLIPTFGGAVGLAISCVSSRFNLGS